MAFTSLSIVAEEEELEVESTTSVSLIKSFLRAWVQPLVTGELFVYKGSGGSIKAENFLSSSEGQVYALCRCDMEIITYFRVQLSRLLLSILTSNNLHPHK